MQMLLCEFYPSSIDDNKTVFPVKDELSTLLPYDATVTCNPHLSAEWKLASRTTSDVECELRSKDFLAVCWWRIRASGRAQQQQSLHGDLRANWT